MRKDGVRVFIPWQTDQSDCFLLDSYRIIINVWINYPCSFILTSTLAPLRISPRLGNVLGGTAISISGPCFGPMDTITCTFEGPLPVAGVYISQLMAICVSPFFEVEGWKPLTVEIMSPRDDIYSRDTRFYAGKYHGCNEIFSTY